jgi:DNA polymerase III subunit epsilon
MLYAITDIETTGSFAASHGITEIAIVIHDGTKVIDFFESLVNPHVPIPYFIQKLTGIDNAMVASAPDFSEIAPKIFKLLHNKVFVAHNVNFDYSFVKHHMDNAGYPIDLKKLCTVRMARRVLPGMPSYSLGKLTHFLGITHSHAHRAGGDALATADLFALIVAKDSSGVIASMLKGKNKESYLPPQVPVDEIDRLPDGQGVYYFHNNAGKIIYVGKAKNICKRVKSHFSNNNTNKQRQDFLRETSHISYKRCGTELMASILESVEIAKLWPQYNKSQKGYQPQFALLTYEDRTGYMRFAIEKNRTGFSPVYTFATITEGQQKIKELVGEFGLCSRLCNTPLLFDQAGATCSCTEHPVPSVYNSLVQKAITQLKKKLPTFAIIDNGIEENEVSCILVIEGKLFGMGYMDERKLQHKNIETLKKNVEPLPDNDFIRNLVFRHATEFPYKCVYY